MQTEFVVMSSREKMPNSCWGTYSHVAVVEIEKGTQPKMISSRAKGVVRIIEDHRNLFVGKTERCAYEQALRDAARLCEKLNDNK